MFFFPKAKFSLARHAVLQWYVMDGEATTFEKVLKWIMVVRSLKFAQTAKTAELGTGDQQNTLDIQKYPKNIPISFVFVSSHFIPIC